MCVSLSRATMMGAACFALAAMLALETRALAQDDPSKIFNFPPANSKGKKGKGGGTPTPENITVAKGFKVERLYVVPQSTQGSWVVMTVDPQGRIVAAGRDSAGIFRITPPPLGGKPEDTKVEKLKIDLTTPNGLLYAFDSFYVMKCGGSGNRPSGLYRVTASKPGGEYDTVTLLRSLNGSGDHGPHYVQLSPDGKSLTVVCGNSTKVTEFSNSYLPRIWGEDATHPLLASFGGVNAPAGWIARVDPEGKKWDLYSAGFRNQYGAVYNHNGDLFTYDSDMEWDIGLPWYRPSRVSMAASGGDAGFRNGSRNMPPRYPDSLPGIIDIGLGSPVGVGFGYGAKFPAKYQEAFFINDWSYGRMLAVHLKPQGSSYAATAEPFLFSAGLSLTDVVINPKDGAMYFCIGGNSQSALYRVTYVGSESTAPAKNDETFADQRAIRHKLEAFHGKKDAKAVETAWPYLSSDDRFIRFAARVAIEHQDVKQWQDLALKETNPVAAIHGLLALVRTVGKDQTKGGAKGGGKKGGGDVPSDDQAGGGKNVDMKSSILDALERIDVAKLSDSQKCDILRVYSVLFTRMGKPDDARRDKIIKRFDPLFPVVTNDYNIGLNADLCELLCNLEAPGIQAKVLKAIEMAQKRPQPPTQAWTAKPYYQGPVTHSQVEELTYAWHLAYVKTGWQEPQKKQIADLWKNRFSTFKGGNLYNASVNSMRQSTLQNSGQAAGLDPEGNADLEFSRRFINGLLK